MKKIFSVIVALASVMPMAAQETYEMAEVATEDLNGTARYVGMGGAMEALGADISTMSSNPAGVGLFRRSQISGSMGLVFQGGASSYGPANKTNVSFDQLGFVFAGRLSRNSFINFGFNYHKSRNFNQILSVTDRLDGASQSKLTLDKFAMGLISKSDDYTYTQADVLYHEALYDTNLIFDDGSFNTDAYRFNGNNYRFDRGNTGYISEFDFNLSGNINDRVYLGLTLGIHDVHYHGYSVYDEQVANNSLGLNTATLEDSRDITGSGFDIKLGAIVRPVEESPFRFGVFIHTPIFYNLKSDNKTGLRLNNQYYADENPRYGSYEYEFRTPWKFGATLGHTFGRAVAVGVTYDFSDYGSTDARIKTGSYYNTSTDREMNNHVKQTLKGVHTVKAGVEFKPISELALRLGYNFVSPMYKQDAYRGVEVYSRGNYYSSETDYTNWKATHRITAGAGYSFDNFRVDLAYQYAMKKGQFLPFAGSDDDNLPFDVEVNNNRHQVLLTLGYTF